MSLVSGMVRGAIACLLAALAVNVYAVTEADIAENLMPDVFSDPRLGTPFGVTDTSSMIDIDTFSGMLSVKIPLVSFPMHGGRSLSLSLSYYSPTIDSQSLPEHSPNGVGWSLHMGYVALSQPLKMCSRLYDGNTLDNPVFVAPDGSSHLLAMTDDASYQSYGATYFSSSGHGVFCDAEGDFIILAPDGTQYQFGEFSAATPGTPAKWYVTRISDTNLNEIVITYLAASFNQGEGRVVSAVMFDNHEVKGIDHEPDYDLVIDFAYTISGGSEVLTAINLPGAMSWNFTYGSAGISALPSASVLTSILDPEGNAWAFTYWPYASDGSGGSVSLKTLENPLGGVHQFTYSRIAFNRALDSNTTNAVTRYQLLSGAAPTQWDYVYETGIQATLQDVVTDAFTLNRTSVDGPDGTDEYYHVGLYQVTNDNLWRIGNLVQRSFLARDSENRIERYEWEKNTLSSENYLRPRDTTSGVNSVPWDESYGVARLKKKTVTVGAATYITEYLSFTSTGLPLPSRPQQVRETTSSLGYSGSRLQEYGYWSNQDLWIWFQPAGVTFDGGNELFQGTGYDDEGNQVFAYAQGKETYRTLRGNGNIASETTGPNPGVSCSLCPPASEGAKAPVLFSEYYAGVPRRVDYPDGGYLVRTVNDYGQILTETNALQEVVAYEYDDVGRITKFTPAIGLPTFYLWTANAVEVTHGTHTTYVEFDGLGRTALTRNSGVPGLTVETRYGYDHMGRVVSTTYEHIESAQSYTESRTYDGLGRLRTVVHPGGQRSLSYQGARISVTDENDHIRIHDYQSFGDLGYDQLVYLDVQDLAPLSMAYNSAGQLLSATRGGVTRSYSYYPSYTLEAISEPETGIEKYYWDRAGNITLVLRIDDHAAPTYSHWQLNVWDDMNRLVEREDGVRWQEQDAQTGVTTAKSWSESFTYDLASRISSNTRNEEISVYAGDPSSAVTVHEPVTWSYLYNANGAVTSAELSVDSRSFALGYEYDDMGYVAAQTYPSGKRVSFSPNAYGWPTQLGEYVTSVAYHPTGEPSGLGYANGDAVSLDLNNRFMLSSMSVSDGGAPLLSKTYVYDPVGNITTISDAVDAARTQVVGYDGADRIASATGIWGAESYQYDDAGNISALTRNGQASTYYYDANNRLASVSGRVTRSYQYNDWGAVIQSNGTALYRTFDNKVFRYTDTQSGADVKMLFDALGRRVRAVDYGDRKQYFVYDPSGKLVYQFNPDDDFYKEYFYLAGQARATRKVQYECSDDVDGDGIPHCIERAWLADPYNSVDASNDNDGDGLTNLQEYQAGTDATLADTDGDLMPDGYEVESGLDPLVTDAAGDLDGDGVSNIDEYRQGTDPAIGDPPRAPATPFATAGDARVLLEWQAEGSVAWRVYRSDQPFEDLAGISYVQLSEPYYLDSATVNGARVYYRVTSVNGFGESAPSPQVSAVPNTLTWKVVNASTVDRQGNAYKLVAGSSSIYVTVFNSDGSAARRYQGYTAPEGKSIQILDKAFGRDGSMVVVWRLGYQTGQIWAAYFHPSRGWKTPTAIASGGVLSGVDAIISDSDKSTAVVAFMRLESFSLPDGSVESSYRPYSAHIDSQIFYWYTERRISIGQSYGGVSSNPYVALSVGPQGDIWAVWEAYYWPEGGAKADREAAVWVAPFNGINGTWMERRLTMRSSEVCCEASLFGSAPVMQVSRDGSAIVTTRTGQPAYALYGAGQWASPESERLTGGFNYDSSYARIITERDGVTSSRNIVSGAGLEVLNVDVVSGRKTSALKIVPESRFSTSRALWLDSAGWIRQSSYGDSGWQEESYAQNIPQNTALFSNPLTVDDLGNILIHNNGSNLHQYAPQGQAVYGIFVDAWAYSNVFYEGATIGLSSTTESLNGSITSYEWSQQGGPQVTIVPSGSTASVALPYTDADVNVTVRLTVTDSAGAQSYDEFSFVLQDRGEPPVVNAGPDQQVMVSEVVLLQASAIDDGQIVSWSWEQVSGSSVSIAGAGQPDATLTAPSSGEYELVFRVTAVDDQGMSSSDEVTIWVEDPSPPPPDDTVAPVVTYDYLYPDPDNSNWDKAWLKSDEPATIYFRLSGPVELVYGWPSSTAYPGWYECSLETCYLTFQVAKRKGTPTIEYFGIDTAGNVSATVTEPMRP